MTTARVLAAIMVAGLMSHGAQAQQILTAINTDDHDEGIHTDLVSTTSGELVSNPYLGTDVRALTEVGVNKAYASTSNGIELSATSAWLDSYTVAASSSPVTVTFNFSIDGIANYGANISDDIATYYNFKVFALRGSGWSINGDGGTDGTQFGALSTGDDYDDLFLQRTIANTPIAQFSVRDESRPGFYNYANVNGNTGQFVAQVTYDELTDAYTRTLVQNPTLPPLAQTFYADRVEIRANAAGPVTQIIYYADGTPNAATLKLNRDSLQANFSLLDSASLCIDGFTCAPATYDLGTQLSLSFQVAGGSTFSIAAILVLDELDAGSLDFFNTAKVSSVLAVNADNQAVGLINPNLVGEVGSYGYPAAIALNPPAVPEPATWAMMIGGFAFAGGLMRRRAMSLTLA